MSKQERSPTQPTDTQRDIGKPVGYFELILQNANFRWLWGGQVVSLLGDWFNLIASAILIAELTDSGLALGILFTIRMLAPFAVAPIAGIFADRYNRKHLLIITDIVRAVVVLGFLSEMQMIFGCFMPSRPFCSVSAVSSVRHGVLSSQTLPLHKSWGLLTRSAQPPGR